MKPVNITSYLQRPVDNTKEPTRIPMTEWEYEEIHAGERPRTGNSSSDSDLYEFSVGSEESTNDSDKDDLMSLCHPPSYNEPDLLKLDPNQIGKSLRSDLDFIASSHFDNEKRIRKNKETAKIVMSTFKYTYFDDFISDDDEVEDHKDFSPKKKSKGKSKSNKSKNSPNKNQNQNQKSNLNAESTTIPEVSFKEGIAKRTSQLREKKSPKKTHSDDFSEDSDVELLKTSSSTIKNSKLPFKKEICETTNKHREDRKPKPKQDSDDEYYLDKEKNDTQTDDFQITNNDTLENSNQKTDFFRSETTEMTKKESEAASNEPQPQAKDKVEQSKVEDSTQDIQEYDIQIDSIEEDVNISNIETDNIPDLEAAEDNQNQTTNNNTSTMKSKLSTMNSNQRSKTQKSSDHKHNETENPSKYEANPPSMFAKYMEEHPPPPKPKDDTPTRFKYKPKPLVNEAPQMFTKNPPKPPPKVETKSSSKIRYNPNEIPDQPPSFYNNPSRMKKQKALTDEEREIKELKRQAEVKDRVKYQFEQFEEIDRIYSSPKKEKKDNPEKESKPDAKKETEMNSSKSKKEEQEYSYKNRRNWKEKGDLMKKREKYMKKKQLVRYMQEKLLTKEDRDLIRRKEILDLKPQQELHRLIKISDDRDKEAKLLKKKKAAFAKKVPKDPNEEDSANQIDTNNNVEIKPVKTKDSQTTKKEKDKSHFINKVDKSLCAAEVEAKLAKLDKS